MSLRKSLLAASAAAFLALGAAASAQPMMAGRFHHGEMMEILHGLKLTEAQESQVREIMKSAWEQDKPVMEQLHKLHEQLMGQMLSPGQVTAEQLAPLVQQEEQLRTQLDQSRLNAALRVRALLTPEQLAQAASTHQKLAALHQQEKQILDHED